MPNIALYTRGHRATKLMAWVHRERPGTAAHHILPGPKGGSETLDSEAFERTLAPALPTPRRDSFPGL